ncbi:MAG: KH domain-containing protein [Candidatus Wallbacteria bacterium]|nr:KH domain-containing protein [Candidatus Wallbacteria bacterium]
MEDLLRYMVKSLVDNPDQVEIKKVEGEKTIILELKVAEGDVGKVIGKHGKTINAIRTIVKSSINKESKKVMVEILQ